MRLQNAEKPQQTHIAFVKTTHTRTMKIFLSFSIMLKYKILVS